jgi:hypothetical protein
LDPAGWQTFYQSDLQQVVLLLPVPALWLAMLLGSARFPADAFPGAGFLRAYAVVFCIETLLDPIATGPLTRALDLPAFAATAVMFVFVLLGDFRVFLLVAVFTRGHAPLGPALREAALFSLVVPVFAGAAHAALAAAVGGLPGQSLWLLYELGFAALAAWLRWRRVPALLANPLDPRRRALARVLAFVVVYYGLWAMADALILFGGLDAGWLLRILPNQLYYSFYVPFVCLTFWRR